MVRSAGGDSGKVCDIYGEGLAIFEAVGKGQSQWGVLCLVSKAEL